MVALCIYVGLLTGFMIALVIELKESFERVKKDIVLTLNLEGKLCERLEKLENKHKGEMDEKDSCSSTDGTHDDGGGVR